MIIFVAKVIGKIVASFPGVQYGQLHYQQLECAKIQALKCNKGSFDAYMSVTLLMRQELQWWIDTVETQSYVISHCNTEITMCTDACTETSGWGAHIGELTTRGNFCTIRFCIYFQLHQCCRVVSH